MDGSKGSDSAYRLDFDQVEVKELGFAGACPWVLKDVGATRKGDPRAFASCYYAIFAQGKVQVRGAIVSGAVPKEPRGARNFGWDCMFQALGNKQTFAELPPEQKDSLSPRGQALREILENPFDIEPDDTHGEPSIS